MPIDPGLKYPQFGAAASFVSRERGVARRNWRKIRNPSRTRLSSVGLVFNTKKDCWMSRHWWCHIQKFPQSGCLPSDLYNCPLPASLPPCPLQTAPLLAAQNQAQTLCRHRICLIRSFSCCNLTSASRRAQQDPFFACRAHHPSSSSIRIFFILFPFCLLVFDFAILHAHLEPLHTYACSPYIQSKSNQ